MRKEIALVLAIIVFITIGFYYANRIGYYYDEYLHAVSSQRIIAGEIYNAETPMAIKKEIWGRAVPLMILYYVGPLKSYALTIPFALFGSSVETLRITTISLASINLLLVYMFTKRYFRSATALLTALLLALDPSYILSATLDWGPIATQQILKTLLLLTIFALNKSTKRYKLIIFFIGLLISISIWDKLNAIWFIIPFGIYALVQIYKNQPRKISPYGVLTIGLLIGALPFIVFASKRPNFYQISRESFVDFEKYLYIADTNSGKNLVLNYSSRIEDKLSTLTNTLNGNSIPNHILINPISGGIFAYVFFAFLLYWIIQTFIQIKNRQSLSHIHWITLFNVIIIIFTIITPNANAIHHMLLLWPLGHILVATTIVRFYQRSPIALSVLTILIVLGSALTLYNFAANLSDTTSKIYWRKKPIPELINQLNQKKQYISLDWGISLPVAYLSNGKYAIKDLQPFYKPKCNELKAEPNTVYILHSENNEVFSQFRKKCSVELGKYSIEEKGAFTLYSPK